MIAAIVPVKALDQAKRRLASLLSQEERRRLSLAMLEDVLRAVQAVPRIDHVAVVSPDPAVLARVRKLGALLRNATYQGVTPDFWATCDAIGNEKTWRMWGVLNCAKGEPVQTMHVGHGAAPTRFSRVRVGVLQDR